MPQIVNEEPMALDKLLDALRELERRRAEIDESISHVHKAIAALRPAQDSANPVGDILTEANLHHAPTKRRRPAKSLLADAIAVLTSIQAPLHIQDLAKYIEAKTGTEVSRASLEGVLTREIRQNRSGRTIVRVGPGTYTVQRYVKITPESFVSE
jgi:hypothetical protein